MQGYEEHYTNRSKNVNRQRDDEMIIECYMDDSKMDKASA